jgi:hypothetical protein
LGFPDISFHEHDAIPANEYKTKHQTHTQKCIMDFSLKPVLKHLQVVHYSGISIRFVAAFFTEVNFSRGITTSVNFQTAKCITCFQAMCCTMEHHFEATKQLDL